VIIKRWFRIHLKQDFKLLSQVKEGKVKKSVLIDRLEEAGIIDKELSIAAKHSKLKGLLNPISISGGLENPLVEVEYRGRQSNVILTTQGQSTLKIFGWNELYNDNYRTPNINVF